MFADQPPRGGAQGRRGRARRAAPPDPRPLPVRGRALRAAPPDPRPLPVHARARRAAPPDPHPLPFGACARRACFQAGARRAGPRRRTPLRPSVWAPRIAAQRPASTNIPLVDRNGSLVAYLCASRIHGDLAGGQGAVVSADEFHANVFGSYSREDLEAARLVVLVGGEVVRVPVRIAPAERGPEDATTSSEHQDGADGLPPPEASEVGERVPHTHGGAEDLPPPEGYEEPDIDGRAEDSADGSAEAPVPPPEAPDIDGRAEDSADGSAETPVPPPEGPPEVPGSAEAQLAHLVDVYQQMHTRWFSVQRLVRQKNEVNAAARLSRDWKGAKREHAVIDREIEKMLTGYDVLDAEAQDLRLELIRAGAEPLYPSPPLDMHPTHLLPR